MSLPTAEWTTRNIAAWREASREESDVIIPRLASANGAEARIADEVLKQRVYDLSTKQLEQIEAVSPGAVSRWEAANASQAEREIRQGMKNGWIVSRYENGDEKKLFVYRSETAADESPIPRYLLNEGPNNTWNIHRSGASNSHGVVSYGARVGTMRVPANVSIETYKACEYCGAKAVGHCHMRNKYVCERHRFFTQNGVNWKCP